MEEIKKTYNQPGPAPLSKPTVGITFLGLVGAATFAYLGYSKKLPLYGVQGAIAGGATCATVSLLGAIRLGVAAKKTPPGPLDQNEVLAQLIKTPEKLDLSNLAENVSVNALLKELAPDQASKIKEIIYKEGTPVEITLTEEERPILAKVLKLAPKGAKITIQGEFSLKDMRAIASDAKDKSVTIELLVLRNATLEEIQKLPVMVIGTLTFENNPDDIGQIPKIIGHLTPQKIVFQNVSKDIKAISAADWKELSTNYLSKFIILPTDTNKNNEENYENDKKVAENSLNRWCTGFNTLKDAEEPTAPKNISWLLDGGNRHFNEYPNASWNIFLEKRGE